MRLSLDKIKKIKPKTKRQYISVQSRSSLFFVVERENYGGNCKRFEGITHQNGKKYTIPMGIWEKDVIGVKGLNKLIREWEDLKVWKEKTGKNPKLYFEKERGVCDLTSAKSILNDFN